MFLDFWDLYSNAHDNAVDVLEKEDGGIVYHAHWARKLLNLFRKSRLLCFQKYMQNCMYKLQRQYKFKRMLKLFWLNQFVIRNGKSLFSFESIKIF